MVASDDMKDGQVDRGSGDDESILAALPEAVIGVSSEELVVYFNRAAEHVFGYGRSEILGRRLDELLPAHVRTKHTALVREFRQSPLEARYMHERREVAGRRRDGSLFPAEVTLVKDHRQTTHTIFAILRDISEQHRRQAALAASERKYRAIIEASPEPILIADAESGRLVEANDAAANLFQCDRAHLIGLHQTELHPVPHRERFRRTFREHIDAGRITVPDGVILTASGKEVHVKISASPVIVEDGLHLVGFFHDMTDQLAHEHELQRALDAARASVTAKKMFLANMTHELRTPLNGVIGFAELIAREIHGPHSHASYKEYGEIIHTSGQHLLSIVNDLLDLSSLEMGRLALLDETIPVVEVVEECRRMLDTTVKGSGVRLSVRVPEGFCLLADRRTLKQMILNLVSNSLKFTGRGGEVTIEAALDESDAPVLIVSDTGTGIDSERLAKIAEPFAASDNIYTRQKGGTGIGLSITKGLIERHGGRLEISSEVGIGTAVKLVFPVQRLRLESCHPSPTPPRDQIGVRQ